MNDDFIVPVYVVIDTVMQALDHQTHRLAHILGHAPAVPRDDPGLRS
jgi:hypothetical protein